jgi:hypothetical protein
MQDEDQQQDRTPEQATAWAETMKPYVVDLIGGLNQAGFPQAAELIKPVLLILDRIPGELAEITGDKDLNVHYRLGRPVIDSDDSPFDHESSEKCIAMPCDISGEMTWLNNDATIQSLYDKRLCRSTIVKRISMFAAMKQLGTPLDVAGATEYIRFYVDYKDPETRAKIETAAPDHANRMRAAEYVVNRLMQEGLLDPNEDLAQYSSKAKFSAEKLAKLILGSDTVLGGLAETSQELQDTITEARNSAADDALLRMADQAVKV